MEARLATDLGHQAHEDSDPPPSRPATRADLDELPDNVDAEIIEGRLYVMPKPRWRHLRVATQIGGDLSRAYDRGIGGPGGWWILTEPGFEHTDATEVCPDVAGWRRERMPEEPKGPIVTVPDWVCEVLSPGTRAHDLGVKRPFYAKIGVQWMWIVDLEAQLLIVSKLENGRWSDAGTYSANVRVHPEPFESVEFDLTEWWRTK